MTEAIADFNPETVFTVAAAVVAFAFAGAALQRRKAKGKVRPKPLPRAWRHILQRNVPFHAELPARLRPVFNDQLRRFLETKKITGAGGFEVTDEVRVTVAAAAVRLTLALDFKRYRRLSEIIIYEGDYLHPEEEPVYAGEAHAWGVVVLSWESVLEGLQEGPDGVPDTATHEFAHAIDRASGEFDGTPELRSMKDYPEWVQTMSRRFINLRKGRQKELSVLDPYGAENEAEFFAVASEVFFNRPGLLLEVLPDLYGVLRRFYGQDPARAGRGAPSDRRRTANA